MKRLHHIIAVSFIIGIVTFLLLQNFVPNTSLIGWDDLHPEYNFQTAIARTFEGVWRGDQGLGAVAAHSHMAELPRIILMWIMSFVIPSMYLRFAFVSLCLYSGAIGMYVLCYFEFNRLTKKKVSLFCVSISALFSSLVYTLNLGTVQQFILPFEMFAVQFAMMPWVLFVSGKLIDSFSKKKLLLFVLVSLLFASTAYAATLWYMFFVMFFFWMMLHIKKTNIRKIIVTLALFIVANLFWILPNLYFTINHSSEVQNSKQNIMFSQEIFEKNKEFGTLQNALLLKGFLFDWNMYDFKQKIFVPVMDRWSKHLNNPEIAMIGYLISLVGIVGIVLALKQNHTKILPYIVFFCIPVFFLLSNTSPFSEGISFLTSLSPIFKEAFRNPSTKVSIPAGFGIAFFFGYMMLYIKNITKPLYIVVIALSFTALIIFSLPAFQGQFIQSNLQIKMPSEYKKLFQYFDSQPIHARVALFPVSSMWNWTTYTWGYQGAGFLQFGIRQPILDRDYDRWSASNEAYFREMSHAVYSQNSTIVKNVIQKYDIQYVVIDQNVFEPSLGPYQNNLNWFTPKLLQQTNLFEPPLSFGKQILVYKKKATLAHDVYLLKNTRETPLYISSSPLDFEFNQSGNYFSKIDGRLIFQKNDSYSNPLPKSDISYQIDLVKNTDWNTCGGKEGIVSRRVVGNSLYYDSTGADMCETFSIPYLEHQNAYLLSIQGKHIEGRPLEICLKNLLTNHCDLYEQLREEETNETQIYYVPRLWDFGTGYQLEMAHRSSAGQRSINTLESVQFDPIESPDIVDVTKRASSNMQTQDQIQVQAQNISSRSLSIQNISEKDQSILVLSQRFEDGWKAYDLPCQNSKVKCQIFKMFPMFFGKELKEHVLVNNWANGFLLPPTTNHQQATTIVIIFWPQYLEYLGFGILAVILLLIILMT